VQLVEGLRPKIFRERMDGALKSTHLSCRRLAIRRRLGAFRRDRVVPREPAMPRCGQLTLPIDSAGQDLRSHSNSTSASSFPHKITTRLPPSRLPRINAASAQCHKAALNGTPPRPIQNSPLLRRAESPVLLSLLLLGLGIRSRFSVGSFLPSLTIV
jgi:hypothetical protein